MAYAWDPVWLKEIGKRPRSVLTLGGKPVLVQVPADEDAMPARAAVESDSSIDGYEPMAAETAELTNVALRKRERPFVLPLDPNNPEPVERAAYDAAYKGVTDALTLYLWRRPAFYLTRWAARAGLSPNSITTVGAVLCVLAFVLFWRGEYWWGSATYSTTGSTSSIRPSGGGHGSTALPPTGGRSRPSMRPWCCG
jgi:hypothetical protein